MERRRRKEKKSSESINNAKTNDRKFSTSGTATICIFFPSYELRASYVCLSILCRA